MRVAGADRYQTAARLSAATFPTGVPIAFVATGTAYPDALASGAAAGMLGGPMLLTRPSELPASTATELSRLRPAAIVVLGGTGAVSTAVEVALRAYGPVTRIAGADRYETAAAVAGRYFPAAQRAWLATGAAYPDALAATPVAGSTDAPLLLTRPTSLPATTAAQLRRLAPRQVFVAGGSGAVGSAVITAVRATLDP